MNKMALKIACSGIAVAFAKIQWKIGGDALGDRRAGFVMDSSTTDTDHEDCIVAGYDEDMPEKVYVGGPCSELDSNAQPRANFRYMSLGVADAGWQKGGIESDDLKLTMLRDVNYQYPYNGEGFMSIGTGGAARLPNTKAGFVLSQMSYLSKSQFKFKTNQFIAGNPSDDDNWIETCVTPCCTPPSGQNSCGCATEENSSACSGADLPVEVGQYKFSVFMATIDLPNDMDTTGNAWSGSMSWNEYVEANGVNDSDGHKSLAGNMYVDQLLDFSHMQTDTLTINAPGGSSVRFADMGSWEDPDSTWLYTVKDIKLESDTFKVSFTFPLTFNLGSWDSGDSGFNAVHQMVRNVKIYCVKVPQSYVEELGDSYNGSNKVVIVRYMFDVEGIGGSANSGNWFAYDPTIEQIAGTTTATPTSANGGTTTANGDTSNGNDTAPDNTESSVSSKAQKHAAIVAKLFVFVFFLSTVNLFL